MKPILTLDKPKDESTNNTRGTKRLYHFLPACYALDDLKSKQIKLSRFGCVNDAQELGACRFLGYEHNHGKLADIIKAGFRFLCLTSDFSSGHMWKQYGENGQGMCFALDINCESIYSVKYVPKGSPKQIELPLNLKEQLIEGDHQNDTGGVEQLHSTYTKKLRHVCTTKFDVDGYSNEREERAFFNKSAWRDRGCLQFTDFTDSDLILKGVILGEHGQETEESILALVEDYPCQPVVVQRHVA